MASKILATCVGFMLAMGLAHGLAQTIDTSRPITNRSLSEYPAGAIDGNNSTFTLSKLPLKTGLTVHVDGKTLQDAEFSVDGNVIRLLPSLIPHPGAVILVSYDPMEVTTAESPLISASSTKSLVRKALLNSLLRETLPKPDVSSGADVGEARLPPFSKAKAPRPISLSMLSRRLVKANGSRSSVATDKEAFSGLEGFGDKHVASPYSMLLGEESYDPLKLVNKVKRRAVPSGKQPRSILLLEQKLDDLPDESKLADHRGSQ